MMMNDNLPDEDGGGFDVERAAGAVDPSLRHEHAGGVAR
jgi:hypothetical protein